MFRKTQAAIEDAATNVATGVNVAILISCAAMLVACVSLLVALGSKRV